MITDKNIKYTIAQQWILRKDEFYHTEYTLFNVYTKVLISLSPALYCIIKIFYYNALSVQELVEFMGVNGIPFDYDAFCKTILENNASDLFVQSNNPLHNLSRTEDYEAQIKENVPVATTPIDVELHLTHNCNLACPHCFQDSKLNSDKSQRLTPADWYIIFKQFEDLNMHNIIISGGEPLFYEGFSELIESIINLRLNYVFLTNGMLIDEKNIHYFKSKNVQLTISLDGHTPYIHDAIRGRGAFQKLDKILDLLVNNNVNINIAHTINKINYPYIENFIQYIISKRLKSISFGITEATGRASINRKLLITQEEEANFRRIYGELESKYGQQIKFNFPNLSYVTSSEDYGANKYVFCSAGTRRIAINSHGDVFPCIKAFNYPELKIGNIKETDIISMWNNKSLWRLYRGGITIDQIHVCNECELNAGCALRNCRLGCYNSKFGLYGKPDNCLIDKFG